MSDYMDFLARQAGYSSYSRYLQSEYWTVFCKHIRKKSCFCCRLESQLQVHHITYERLGQEWPTDVITVCDNCHVAIHDIAKAGTDLSQAHIVHRKSLQKKERRNQPQWVSFFKLLNRSSRQTPHELRIFLEHKGLSSSGKATDKAHRLGFVKKKEGREKWHLRKYLHMMQADKKLKKLRRQGKSIHPMVYKRALEQP